MTYKENTKENHERDVSLNGIKTLELFSIKFLIVSAAQKRFDLQEKFLKWTYEFNVLFKPFKKLTASALI